MLVSGRTEKAIKRAVRCPSNNLYNGKPYPCVPNGDNSGDLTLLLLILNGVCPIIVDGGGGGGMKAGSSSNARTKRSVTRLPRDMSIDPMGRIK